jgi:arachidonate 15-lipoxygenase
MASPASLPTSPRDPERDARIERVRRRYAYRKSEENLLHPIASAKLPFWREPYGPSWLIPFLLGWHRGAWRRPRRGFFSAHVRRFALLLGFARDASLFRFDKLAAYERILGELPDFAEDSDSAFAYWRVAGANPLGLVQERSLTGLLARIPLQIRLVEARLASRLARPVSLSDEAQRGRLFCVDFRLLQDALRPEQLAHRDSRWRAKYLPTPIGVFLETDGPGDGGCLVPLAIQIDQLHDARKNPVLHPREVQAGVAPGEGPPPPEGGWTWRLAKLYFEAADVSFQASCGHILRTHLVLEPFAVATPRQLASQHPVSRLLRPHLRFTLAANRAVYAYFNDFYAGTLEESREIAIQSYHKHRFHALELEAELAGRGVGEAPAVYPYRDDARLWRQPIRDFVGSYLGEFYSSDASVRGDGELQDWARELMDPQRGAVNGLVPDGDLDSTAKLADLLSQVIFTAGPGHASQHFPANHYYRHAPTFPGAAYVPPTRRQDRNHEARLRNALPPARSAARQWTYNSFTNYQYDRFGDYTGYDLATMPEAQRPIATLHTDLVEVENEIQRRQAARRYPYPFLLPSRVPNSVNI